MSDNPERVFIGIDLGTTRCCVASLEENNMPKTILNDLGRPTTPSYVYFENDNVHVGDTAINSPNPGKNLIYDAKRLIGRQFDDGHVINDKQTLSYDVVREPNEPNRGKAMINIERNGRRERISPEDVAAELLKKMKQYAEDHFGGDEVQDAVIAVPAYFDTRQRSATMEAARLAGLNVLRLVTEPTAAAIALCMKLRDQAKTVLIYDLGGGTFDVSIGRMAGGELEILGIAGDTHLGGEDFDELIALDFINQFQAMYQVRFPNDSNTRRKLRSRCREIKENMSNIIGDQTIEMPVVVGNRTYELNYIINQRRFHEMLKPKILGTMAIVEDALNNAGLGPKDINNILLVGGSTRIPLIKTLLQQRFGSSKILQNIHPDEAIAIGAAILASQSYPEYNPPEPAPVPVRTDSQAIPGGNNNNNYDAVYLKLNIREAVPLSIGMELHGRIVERVIPRGTTYPCEKSLETGTVEDNQPSFSAAIYEGERPRTRDNMMIGEIEMHDLLLLPRGSQHITTFKVDGNGILTVTHKEVESGREQLFITRYKGKGRPATDVADHIAEARQHSEDDERFKEACVLRRRFETSVHNRLGQWNHLIETHDGRLTPDEKNAIHRAIEEYSSWLNELPENLDDIRMKAQKFEATMKLLFHE